MDINITRKQLSKMKHAIGYGKQSNIKKGSYEAYRNYYNTGEQPSESWDDLVVKGYATMHVNRGNFNYFVTRKGLDLLGDILGVEIIEDKEEDK